MIVIELVGSRIAKAKTISCKRDEAPSLLQEELNRIRIEKVEAETEKNNVTKVRDQHDQFPNVPSEFLNVTFFNVEYRFISFCPFPSFHTRRY